jgi:hypothetical protein
MEANTVDALRVSLRWNGPKLAFLLLRAVLGVVRHGHWVKFTFAAKVKKTQQKLFFV